MHFTISELYTFLCNLANYTQPLLLQTLPFMYIVLPTSKGIVVKQYIYKIFIF
jgi:hypothetical protein